MSAKQIQYAIAAVFFILGGWCLVAPQSVLDLTVRPAYKPDDAIAPLLISCFGAQACIAGIFAAFSTFTRATFLAYGIAVLPFFAFNYWFYFVVARLQRTHSARRAGQCDLRDPMRLGLSQAFA